MEDTEASGDTPDRQSRQGSGGLTSPPEGGPATASIEALSVLVDRTGDIFYRYSFDPQRRFDYVSPAAYAITGYTPAEHYADPDLGLKIVHPEDRDRLEAYISDPQRHGETLTLRWVRKDGRVVWVEQHNVPILDDAGQLIALVGMARDVTEKIRLEEKLRDSEERYRSHFENLPHPAYAWRCENGDFVLIGFNEAARRFTAGGVSGLLGRSAREMYRDEPEVLAEISRCATERRPLESELRYRLRSTGKEVDVAATYVFVPPDVVVVHVEDVTERRAAERELRWMKFALDQAADAVLRLDEHGRVSYVNEAACRLLDATATELTAKTIFDIDLHFEAGEWEERWSRIEQMGHATAETRYRAADGSAIPVEVSASHVADEDGRYLVAFVRDVSERKRTQDELRGQKEFIEQVMDNLPLGLAVSSLADGHGKYTNRRFEEIYGWPAREIRTVEAFFERVFPDAAEREGIKRRFEADIASGDPARLRWDGIEVTRADGEKRIIDAANLLLPDHGLMISTVRDVTDRAQVEEKLRLSHSILQNINNLVIVADASGAVRYLSPSVGRILGYSPEELLGDGWWRLTYEDPAAAARERERVGLVARGRAPGRTTPYERRIADRNGEQRWFLWHDSRGPGDLLIGVAHEISQRKAAEETIRSASMRAQQYLDIAGVMIVVLDRYGTVTLINRKGAEVLGYEEEEELIGRNWFECCIPSEERAGVRRVWDELLADGELAAEHENAVLRRDGEQRLIAWNNVVLRDAGGAVAGVLSSGEDITERRSLEDQLRRSQRMEAVGRLAGGIAHDFNNLLTVILGDTELALSDIPEVEARQRELLQEVMDAGKRAAALTRQLLVFSRRQVVERQIFNLNDLISEVEKMLRRLIEENIDLETRRAPDLGLVNADRGQIEQVLVNLVVNARDAMPEGGKLVIETENVRLDDAWAAAHPGTRGGEYVLLAVTDSGTGMSDEVKTHLFEPFFTTKQRGTGTGLGLATSYAIVQRHGGYISVYSRVNVGTTMAVYLPRSEAESAEPGGGEGPQLPGGTETILLVEDEAAVRRVAARLLKGLGYTVLDAADGFEALKLLEHHQGAIDLLLTDVVLPGLSGRELAERVRADSPGMKVLFCSGYTDDVILERRLLERGEQLVPKPFTIQELSSRVREALDA